MTDTTLTDVLDTAVKVGLGAIIGFGGTLILEWVRSKREKANSSIETKRNLLTKTADYLDNGMNSAAFCSQAFTERLKSSEFSAIDKELEANNYFGKAETYVTLAGFPDLGNNIKLLREEFLKCFKGLKPPVTLTNNQMSQLNSLADNTYRLLASHFSEL